jgi:hypothetical protein
MIGLFLGILIGFTTLLYLLDVIKSILEVGDLDIEKYIEANHPKSTADVERLVDEYQRNRQRMNWF